MCPTPKPGEAGAEGEGGQEPSPAVRGTSSWWWPRRSASWWTGLQAILLVMDTLATLKQDNALAQWARALIAVSDMFVEADKHGRT